MEELQELYQAIRDVIFYTEDMDIKMECVDNLKEKYNNLCENEEDKI